MATLKPASQLISDVGLWLTTQKHKNAEQGALRIVLADAVASVLPLGLEIETTVEDATLTDEECGKLIVVDNGTEDVTITIPEDLIDGFNCQILRLGSGKVILDVVDVDNQMEANYFEISNQYGICDLGQADSDDYLVVGDVEVFEVPEEGGEEEEGYEPGGYEPGGYEQGGYY